MAITFNGSPIFGTHGIILRQPPDHHTETHKFAGIWGEREINLGLAGRFLECYIWIHDASITSLVSLAGYHDSLDLLVGTNGDLVATDDISGLLVDTFPGCTFKGFEPEPGKSKLPVNGANMSGTHFMAGVLRWRQLELSPGP